MDIVHYLQLQLIFHYIYNAGQYYKHFIYTIKTKVQFRYKYLPIEYIIKIHGLLYFSRVIRTFRNLYGFHELGDAICNCIL